MASTKAQYMRIYTNADENVILLLKEKFMVISYTD